MTTINFFISFRIIGNKICFYGDEYMKTADLKNAFIASKGVKKHTITTDTHIVPSWPR
jgi:hypothetical protein